jgi:hypothetical protein
MKCYKIPHHEFGAYKTHEGHKIQLQICIVKICFYYLIVPVGDGKGLLKLTSGSGILILRGGSGSLDLAGEG